MLHVWQAHNNFTLCIILGILTLSWWITKLSFSADTIYHKVMKIDSAIKWQSICFCVFPELCCQLWNSNNWGSAWSGDRHAGWQQFTSAHCERAKSGEQPTETPREPQSRTQAQGEPIGIAHRVLQLWLRQRGLTLHRREALLITKGEFNSAPETLRNLSMLFLTWSLANLRKTWLCFYKFNSTDSN